MSASNYLEESILNHFFRNGNIPSPQTFLALYISDPTDNDTGTEIKGGSYQPQSITFGNVVQNNGKATIQNSNEIKFPVATANWGTISHFGIRTAQTGGQLLASGAVPIPKQIDTGDEVKFNINTLTVTVD